ncbi:acyl-CoA dehydrogenase family protein [Peribacillus frigoritolerans]|uniref:acyl-CoA dehydrogenase family protein n=1 Tax=Peribacillus frigoritolerans TaxID=450367 RepID=UPI00201BCC14|nr:acyl-CoA dehydrogenase family protein [Peribacillus frigoritolerans]
MIDVKEMEFWREKMQKFVEKEMWPHEPLLPRFENTLPDKVTDNIIGKMKEYGLWSLTVPKKLGGQGISTSSYCAVREALGRTVLWGMTGIHLGGSGDPLMVLYHCNDEQKERYLFPLIRGELIASFAQTEPGAGADQAGMKTRAIRKGSGWILHGHKTLITHGTVSDFVIVFAITDPEKGRNGVTCFLVDKGTPGFIIGDTIETMGGDRLGDLHFKDCYIPDSQVLGIVGNGFRMAQNWFIGNRITLQPPICLGIVGRAIEELLRVFPNEVEDTWLGQIQAEYHRARLLMYDAAYKFDKGEEPQYEASLSKVATVGLTMKVLRRALEISGSHGYAEDSMFQRYYRDVRRLPITEGSMETQKMVTSRALIRGFSAVDSLSPNTVSEVGRYV